MHPTLTCEIPNFFYLTEGLHCTCIFRTCVFQYLRFQRPPPLTRLYGRHYSHRSATNRLLNRSQAAGYESLESAAAAAAAAPAAELSTIYSSHNARGSWLSEPSADTVEDRSITIHCPSPIDFPRYKRHSPQSNEL